VPPIKAKLKSEKLIQREEMGMWPPSASEIEKRQIDLPFMQWIE